MLSHAQLFCNPRDCSPPASSVHGISHARTLEWVSISFFSGDLPGSGVEPTSPVWAGRFFTTMPFVLVPQSCPALRDLMDCSPPGPSVHGILQARRLEWVPLSSPGDLPCPRIEHRSPALQADSLPSEPPGKPIYICI